MSRRPPAHPLAPGFGLALLVAGLWTLAPPAFADPCEGRLPSRPGETFSGVVRHVGDGDSLCVGRTDRPDTWVEVRLADFDAPELNAPGGREARSRLVGLVMGRPVSCRAVAGRSGRVISYDRVIAACMRDGRPLGRLIREAGGRSGGN